MAGRSSEADTQQIMLTVPQVAASCGVSPRTVKRWISDHALPVHRLPGASARRIVLLSRSDLEEWLSQFRDVETIDSSVRQTALLLEGVSHKALEAFEPARAAFAASVEIDAESDVGQAATQLLESLD